MYPPDGLLTSENAKHDVEFDPHIIAPDPFASDAYIDEISQTDLLLLTTAQGLNNMNTGEDEYTSGLNGRLRPRKSISGQSNRISRKTESKNIQDKIIRTNTLSKESRYRIDNLVKKSDGINTQLLCPYCDKTFISKQTASKHAHRIHLSSSKQDSFIDCLFCNHAESESNNIIRHMVDSHPNQYFACLDCHTRFLSTSDLAEHKLNVCEKQKLPYRSKLRQKSLEGKKAKSAPESDKKESFHCDNKEFSGGFNGIVISCELKPTQVDDEADIENNITTNLILPSSEGMGHNGIIDKNAVIVLDDIQWKKRISSNFSFHNTDADQILSRLGVVHRTLKTDESTKKDWPKKSTKKDWPKTTHDVEEKFEKCFDTNFYSKIASNVQENLLKHLDGSFNSNTDAESFMKPKESKNCVVINTAEGFPILLANEQYSRTHADGYLPRAIAPKHKWKWDSSDDDKDIIDCDIKERDSHRKNCIITHISNLDIWTQLCMRRKYESQTIGIPSEDNIEKQNLISKELKEILESRQIPSSQQNIQCTDKPTSGEIADFPRMLGLTPTIQPYNLQPAVLSGEWVRPRCYVCCACGEQLRNSKSLSSHISSQHPNAQVEHYEIVGESLLNADILKHLYVPPSQTISRTRPLRGLRECTKCKRPVSLEDLHQHMLDCAGDTPTVRRKCRHRPFGVRKRRPRLPDNRIRKKMRKDIRTGQTNDKNHTRPRPKLKSEVGDAETIRKMLADLPAKRHRVKINPLNSFPRSKSDRKRNDLLINRRCSNLNVSLNDNSESTTSNSNENYSNNEDDDDDDDDDNLPLRPTKVTSEKNNSQIKSINKNVDTNNFQRRPFNETSFTVKVPDNMSECTESNEPEQLSTNNDPKRVNINNDSYGVRQHSNRGGSNNGDNQRPGSSGQDGTSQNSTTPTQNVPLKHSIARLTADSETHDKAVQFHRLFLVQQECNNADQIHLPSDRRVLFENEAIVTKLDKPPLHFDKSSVSDMQIYRKNKLSKQRKGLNDCIAMLKNKLVTNSDAPLPGHVSVQCGSDEPIDQEPFDIEQRYNTISSDVNSVDTPAMLQQMETFPETQEVELETTANDNVKSFQSHPNAACTENEMTIDLRGNEQDLECLRKETIKNQNSDDEANFKLNRRNNHRLDNEISHVELVPPRNTVIRKSPKMSVNYSTQQEDTDLNMKPSQLMESGHNKHSKNITSKDVVSPRAIKDIQDINIIQTQIRALHKNESDESKIQCIATNDVIKENVDKPCKLNSDYSLTEFHAISSSIPAAHANVDSILSTPLDLSGKKMPINLPEENLLHLPFVINSYDNYETLDLSNKHVSADQSLKVNLNTIDNEPIDTVVDLSIRQVSRPPSQSTTSTLLADRSTIDENSSISEYNRIDDNIPTDLTLKNKARSVSVDLTPQRSGMFDVIQDLSNRNSKPRGTIQEHNNKMDDCNTDLPRDLSKSGINDNLVSIDIVSYGSQITSDCQELNRKVSKVDLGDYGNPVNELPQEAADPPSKNSVGEFDHQLQENVFDYTLQSTNIENNSLKMQNNLYQIQKEIHHDPNDKNIELNKNNENNEFMKCDIAPTAFQKSINVVNGSSSSFVENLTTVIVPQDKLSFDIEKSHLKAAVPSKSDYLPHYSLMKSKLTTQFTKDNPEGSTPVHTLGNVAVSATKVDTFCSTLSTYTSARNTIGTLDLNETACNSSCSPNVNCRRSSVLSDSRSIPETENFVVQNPPPSEVLIEDYDHDKDEIIDCDTESDTETARKIALLPKELVEILGTMPVDHRNQLLNVLPQYVSSSAAATSAEISSCLRNKNVKSDGTPSPEKHLTSTTDINCGENKSQSTQYIRTHSEASRQSLDLDVTSDSTYPVITSESLPQSVILKTPTIFNDCYQFVPTNLQCEFPTVISGDAKRDVSILNHESVGSIQNTIIDLTDDENIKVFQDDVQVIDDRTINAKHTFEKNRNLESLLEPPRPKGNSEQTASLRAVRIKAPSERNKQIPSEFCLQSHNTGDSNVGDANINLEEQTLGLLRIGDGREEIYTIEVGNKNIPYASHTHVSHLQNIALVEKSPSGNEKEAQQVNINEKILINPTVILTPISIDKRVHVSQETTCETIINDSLELPHSLDQEIIVLDVDDTNDSNLYEEPVLPASFNNGNANCPSMVKEYHDSSKIFKQTSDEDSEDDVTLAVIVQQKHLCQTKLTLCNDNAKLSRIEVNAENRKRKKGKMSKKTDLKNITGDTEILGMDTTSTKKKENENSQSGAISQNSNTENRENTADSNKEECETEILDSNIARKTRSCRDTSKTVFTNYNKNKEDLGVSRNNELNNLTESTNMQKYKELKSNNLMVPEKIDAYSRINTHIENIIVHTSNSQRRGNVFEMNQSQRKLASAATENATKDDNLLQVGQQPFISLNENNKLDKEISYEEGLKKRKCPKDCIAHNYKQYSVSNINSKNTDMLTKETVIKPQNSTMTTSLLNQDIKLKKTGGKFKKQMMKDHIDSSKSKQLSIENEKHIFTPLRRSRRGKSMFVDKKITEPATTSNVTVTEIRTPLTKKQLIFSKLLLDGETFSEINLDSVATKEPIVVINNVELSSQKLSSVCENNVNSIKQAKNSKRKRSPQSKQKIKKIKPIHYEQYENVEYTTFNQPTINNTDQNLCVQSYTNKINVVLNSSNSINDKGNIVQILQKDPSQNEPNSLFTSEIEKIGEKCNSLSPSHNSALDRKTSTEKRKVSCTVTEADTCHGSITKKFKHNKNELDSKTKICNNNSEAKNKTCYNRTVPVRRTRSKSVIEKSSKSLYDPYDIDLEDMVEGDEFIHRRVQKCSKNFNYINFMKDKPNKGNKREEVLTLNTGLTIRNNYAAETTKNSEDAIDSDDSSKSDVPLKKLVEEREKKNMKINNRINVDQISSATETTEENVHNERGSSSQQVNETNKSEQFMESFGFFSERKPRKSNLIASKKISETFNGMANESDEVNEQSARTSKTGNNKSGLDESNSNKSHTKKSVKRGRKKVGNTKPLTTYCKICQKEFRRPDNYLRHQMTLLHIARLSEVEMKVKTTSILDEPNYLVAYKQQLDRLKMLKDKTKRKKTAVKSPTTMDLPSFEEILANVNRSVRDQQLSRRNLSRDEALFIDCCELLKESHKPDMANNAEQQVTIISNGTEQVTIMSSVTEQVTLSSNTDEHATITSSSQEQVTIASTNTEQTTIMSSGSEEIPAISDVNTVSSHAEITSIDKNNEIDDDIKFDGDVDSITAKNILESEEVRNLEKDLIIGLKEAAAFSQTSKIDFENIIIENESAQKEEGNIVSTSSISVANSDPGKEIEQIRDKEELPKAPPKSKKNPEVKEKMYPDIIENIDIFEDKFDKIKRKCRSQAAAAKHVQPVIEPSTSHKGRKKSEKKKGKKTTKKSYQFTIPTKGALKGFDGLKVSIPTTDINISSILPPTEYSIKKKKTSSSRKKKDEIEMKSKNNAELKVKSTQTQKFDVYEFMDNEEVELFELRPSTLMERFKNLNNKDLPSTSKFVPEAEKFDLTSGSGSDGDDFVYDDYVCSDDETENSMLSCELGSGKIGTETKRSSSFLKRRDVVEKNAVMGKIFKNNAVRTEKKLNKNKEHVKPKANLDQLFDSLLEDEPGSSIGHLQKSPIREELLSPKKQESVVTPSTNESSKIAPYLQKIDESDLEYKSDSSKKKESNRKLESLSSRKPESSKKHKTPSKNKHDSLSSTDYEITISKKEECLLPNKYDPKLSKYDFKKEYISRSCERNDEIDSFHSRESPVKYRENNCKPSISKKHNYTTIQEIGTNSTFNDYEPTTSKSNYDGYVDRSKKYKMHSSSSPKMYNSTSSKRHLSQITKKSNRDSPNFNNNFFQRYSKGEYRDESPLSEIDEDIDTISDCAMSTTDETSSDEGGVARRRARRKCTVGKQNILAETWSSESEPESGLPRPTSAESMGSTVGRKKRRKKRGERQLYSNRRVSRQMPIKRQDVENRVALFKRNTTCVGNGSRPISNAGASHPNSSSTYPSTSASTSTGISPVSASRNQTKTPKSSAGPHASKPRPRSAAYYWSSEGDDEQEHVPQHGWIVGDSHKKLVTMLAHAKGRKRNHDDKRHIIE